MTRLSVFACLLASLLLGLTGCETVHKKRGKNGEVVIIDRGEEKEFEDTKEGQLVTAVEENPEDTKAWFDLGRFYEERKRLIPALRAYERMQALIEEEAEKTGRDYVGGLYLLGKTHALLKNWRPAVDYLRRVLEKQPADLRAAMLNRYFRESHFLLGAIYFEHRMYEPAERHLVTFTELSQGKEDHRANGMLMEIASRVHPSEAGERRPVARLTGKDGTLIIEETAPAKASSASDEGAAEAPNPEAANPSAPDPEADPEAGEAPGSEGPDADAPASAPSDEAPSK